MWYRVIPSYLLIGRCCIWSRLGGKSRMSRDIHVRICERLGVKLPRATQPVAHCRSESEAKKLLAAIENRLRECKLEMHPEKSGIVYCKDSNRRKEYRKTGFTFLGY